MWDNAWEKVFRENEWGKYPGESLIRFIARNFYKAKDRSAVKILEVGCGPGANLWYMLREGFSVVGIDGSRTAVQRALSRLEAEQQANVSEGGTFSVIEGDILDLPFADKTFDAVIDSEAVYANPYRDAQQMYREMARVAKPGGKCYSKMFADGTWGCAESGETKEGPMAGKGYTRITTYEEIPALMDAWDIVSIDMEMRTEQGFLSNQWIKEWVVTAVKAEE